MVDHSSHEDVSKTQKKRQAEALRSLGVRLTELSVEKLRPFELPEALFEAICLYKKITAHGAKRRQAQLIGKLMRRADYERVTEQYDALEDEQKGQTAAFHLAEQWRTRLIEEPDSLTEFIQQYSPEAIQSLRQAIQKARHDLDKQRNTGGAKALFRLIKEMIE